MDKNECADRQPIRSFVRRRGRITACQKQALNALWAVYGLDQKGSFCPDASFGRSAPFTIEIGFGNGGNLADTAEINPDNNYLGIEVHEPGIGHLMNILAKREINNVRIFRGDAVEILRDRIDDQSVDRINLFFPDPWPKKRHHKRRLVSLDFASLVSRKLKTGGFFHIATDWEDYAYHMIEILEGLENLCVRVDTNFCGQTGNRSVTRFEKRGLSLGHKVQDMIYIKQ